MCKRNSTGSDSVRTKRYKKATVYLVLQCVLLLEAIILLLIEHRTKTHQYENSAVTFNNTMSELHSDIENLVKRKDELENANNETTKQNHQLAEEEKLLSKHLREMDGWMCSQSSLYYISSEEKNWNDSNKDCLKRGANLTIINSNDEQDFVKKISANANVWIGLTDIDVEGSWKWVDGSALTSGFWDPREPNGHRGENCALTYSPGWADYPCSNLFLWICEKSILK
ncbi:hypothetical protein cypCar_00031016 [Cyprinus carpio]|nr:hypothetical protein cypCar_00031016 [Cyprinus carpio]